MWRIASGWCSWWRRSTWNAMPCFGPVRKSSALVRLIPTHLHSIAGLGGCDTQRSRQVGRCLQLAASLDARAQALSASHRGWKSRRRPSDHRSETWCVAASTSAATRGIDGCDEGKARLDESKRRTSGPAAFRDSIQRHNKIKQVGPSPSPSVGRFGASLWRHTPSNVTAVRLPRTVPPPARERGERGDSPTQSYREPRARPDHYGANLRWPPHS